MNLLSFARLFAWRTTCDDKDCDMTSRCAMQRQMDPWFWKVARMGGTLSALQLYSCKICYSAGLDLTRSTKGTPLRVGRSDIIKLASARVQSEVTVN